MINEKDIDSVPDRRDLDDFHSLLGSVWIRIKAQSIDAVILHC